MNRISCIFKKFLLVKLWIEICFFFNQCLIINWFLWRVFINVAFFVVFLNLNLCINQHFFSFIWVILAFMWIFRFIMFYTVIFFGFRFIIWNPIFIIRNILSVDYLIDLRLSNLGWKVIFFSNLKNSIFLIIFYTDKKGAFSFIFCISFCIFYDNPSFLSSYDSFF